MSNGIGPLLGENRSPLLDEIVWTHLQSRGLTLEQIAVVLCSVCNNPVEPELSGEALYERIVELSGTNDVDEIVDWLVGQHQDVQGLQQFVMATA